ncbi:MAG: aldehyde dehydrogenase [marine bacterium B5-7]|nr:MAG: aldehyde dehydrogenase [marine bacterium B5-7]
MSEVLERFRNLSGKVFVGGEFRSSKASNRFDVINPATEEQLGEIADTTMTEVDDAVDQANTVKKSWARKSALERAQMLHDVADKMKRLKPLLAEALTREMGKTYKESVDEVDWSVHSIRYSAEIGRSDAGRVMGNATQGQFHYTLKQPYGVAALILPFNYPLVLLAWEAGAALAAGNAVIVKPSEYTTLSTLLFAEAFNILPDGLFQVVSGGGDVGRAMVEHKGTHVVAFTGSVPVGQLVSETCGRLMKPSLIETSGNDPFIVMPSAPVELTARAAAFSAYMNCGQICVSAERFFVHQDIHDEFIEQLAVEAKKIRIGNGLGKVDMGPMVAAKERARYENTLNRAIEQGAKVLTGGGRPGGLNTGWFVEPTVLVNCSADMEIFNHESFGPVAPITCVSSFDEAITLANRSNYGLGANIYTKDLKEAIRATEEIEAGMVWVNAPLLDNDAGPFGGTKLSGMGRQLGPEGIETFRQTKTVMIDPECEPQDFWWFPYADSEMYPDK